MTFVQPSLHVILQQANALLVRACFFLSRFRKYRFRASETGTVFFLANAQNSIKLIPNVATTFSSAGMGEPHDRLEGAIGRRGHWRPFGCILSARCMGRSVPDAAGSHGATGSIVDEGRSR
jgi:hypothetical protein